MTGTGIIIALKRVVRGNFVVFPQILVTSNCSWVFRPAYWVLKRVVDVMTTGTRDANEW